MKKSIFLTANHHISKQAAGTDLTEKIRLGCIFFAFLMFSIMLLCKQFYISKIYTAAPYYANLASFRV